MDGVMIEKFEFRQLEYGDDHEIKAKINEIIDHLNGQKQEPKWKLGEEYYYIVFNANAGYGINWCSQGITEVALETIRNGDTNYFKTKESAEAALAEIKQIMEKYE
jgi:hypothetical protein